MNVASRLLLIDIGNTHTHLGLGNGRRVLRQANIPTAAWFEGDGPRLVRRFVGRAQPVGAALCSVVPRATSHVARASERLWGVTPLRLSPSTITGLGINYPNPKTIGPDRLANAVAARRHYGAPVVIVDFGTAVTFDVVDRRGDYVGGIIAPGLAAMTDYLHEKTALLPSIKIREVNVIIGKNTRESMLIGVVHGYRGLIGGLLHELKGELKCARLPVVATGGYAGLMAAHLPEITAVEPRLTLEGIRLVWLAHQP